MWERDLEIKHLVALQAVAAERSFGRAADRLGFTQSAISQQIAALERVVGEPVFDRPGGPRPVELTPAGQVLLDHAEAVFRQLHQAEEEVTRLRAGDGGSLVVGTFQSVSVKVLPEVIRRLKAERPLLDIRLFEADDLDILGDRIVEGQLDLAFMVGTSLDERFTSIHLMDDPYLLISARTGESKPLVVPTAGLDGVPLVGEYFSSCQAGVDRALRAVGVEPNYVFRTNDNGAVQAMVRVGVGVAVLPVLAVDTADPEVVAQQLDPPIPPRRITHRAPHRADPAAGGRPLRGAGGRGLRGAGRPLPADPGRQLGRGRPGRCAGRRRARRRRAALLDEALQRLQVAPPDLGEDHPAADGLAGRAAQPPREVEVLVPREACAAAPVRTQREPSPTGDDARVLDAHRLALDPLGDRHVVADVERPDLGVDDGRRADASRLVGGEADRRRVAHPVDVVLDGFDDAPDRLGRGVDVDRHRDPAHGGAQLVAMRATERSSCAASSGGAMLIITPVPRSNPATVTSLGHRWACQWKALPCWWGAVWKTRL